MCRKRLGEEPWGSRDTHRLTRGFPLDSHNESSDYLAHLATSKWPRRRAFSPQAVALLAIRVLLPSTTACVHAALSSEQRDQRAS
jgi:hypothetical protein